MTNIDYSILICPITKESLSFIVLSDEQQKLFNKQNLENGLINESQSYLYPIINEILVLLPNYAVQLDVDTNHDINSMSFDKERVFRYYNSIEYEKMDDSVVYADAKKFVDFRDLTRGYLENSFLKIKQFIPENGFYFLDIASGPIGLKEYIVLSSGYEKRICIDISFNALVQAKYNYGTTRGIYICGDIANIPLKEGICDVTISQHTLYHVPKDEQKKAIEELYRVTKNNGTIAIVYSWFYHSMLMNITLLPVQLYRITRHLAGKLYVRIWTQKPRLYFYPHGPFWFKNLGYGNNLKIYSWRSLNTQFMKVYIHKWLYGEKILTFFQKLEDRFPKTMGLLGEYPLILITKKKG